MIPKIFIEQWRKEAPWQTLEMIEQDLIISRALVELYSQPRIQEGLAFRGGTALNKLFLKPPARYSEDIDFVQIKSEPIGETLTQIRKAMDPWLGEPKRKLTERSVKLIYKYQSIDDTPRKLKLEINTTEHFSVESPVIFDYQVSSEWFNGQARITSYPLDELMATKLRALYQRRKGRDLFDLWHVLEKKLINPQKVLSIFEKYCTHNQEPISRAQFEESMRFKRQHPDFKSEMGALITPEILWDFEKADDLVTKNLIAQLPGAAWNQPKK